MADGQQVVELGVTAPVLGNGEVAIGEAPRWQAAGDVVARPEGRSVGFSGSEYHRAGGGMAGFEPSGPQSQVKPRPVMRRYTKEYKLQVLKHTDNLPEGEVGAYLRREGLYYSTLKMFREHRQRGLLEEGQPSIAMKGGRGQRPRKGQRQSAGPEAGSSPTEASEGGVSVAQMQRRIAELEKQNRKLSHRVRQTETLLELQKKASELLGISLEGIRLNEE